MRLIDADKLNLWTALRPYCSSDVCCEVTDIINNAPTVNPYEWISVEVEALNEEDAKKKVYDNLVATNQIKPADYVKIDVATEVNV